MQNENKNLIKVDKPQKLKIGRRTIKFLKENKLISIIVITFLGFAGINFYLIYSFMKIMQTTII